MPSTSISVSDDIGRIWLDRAYQYSADVISGATPACKYVEIACERFEDDLKFGFERGIYFDEERAARYFRFVGRYCKHYIGEWAGRPIDFEPWQCFVEANLHGWVKQNERGHWVRRFTKSYEEVARKNGKSTKFGAAGDYYLIADGERGAQVYVAATKREQTKEIFDAAAQIINSDSILRKKAQAFRSEIRCGNSVLLRLSKDAKRMDGFNVHAGLVDELHAHPDSAIWDVLESATGARSQPLLRAITTAGFDKKSFAYELRAYLIKVLEGVIRDDSFFGIIYTLDDPEKWDDESEWIKANPNLGVSVSLEQLREQCKKAKEMPSARVEFMTKRLNIWLHGESLWMPVEKFSACEDWNIDGTAPFDRISDLGDLAGAECYGGLDIASHEDLASFALNFPRGERRRIYQRSYLPESSLERRFARGDRTLQQFVDSGHLVLVPGDVLDQKWIKADIMLAAERFDLRSVFYDRWNSSQLVTECLEHDIPMVGFGQGFASISAPMKELMRLVLTRQLEYNDPLLLWAVSNVVAVQDPAGNIKTDKSKVSEKIDPAQAAIMAIAGGMKPEDDDTAAILDYLG